MLTLEQSEWMSADEIRELTDLRQAPKQAQWLEDRGIPHRLEGRKVKLSRVHVRAWLEGARLNVGGGINWGAVK
jgi:hypothetical protein